MEERKKNMREQEWIVPISGDRVDLDTISNITSSQGKLLNHYCLRINANVH